MKGAASDGVPLPVPGRKDCDQTSLKTIVAGKVFKTRTNVVRGIAYGA